MATDADQLLMLAWRELSEAIPLSLHDFPHIQAIRLREGLWRLKRHEASLNIQLLADEGTIRAVRRLQDGSMAEREFRATAFQPNVPLLADQRGSLGAPVVVLLQLLEWLVEGSKSIS